MSVSVLDALNNRRTVRNYDSEYQIPKEQLDTIIKAGQYSPTACDFQPVDFIVVTNKDLLNKMEEATVKSLPESDFKKHFIERKQRHGVKNCVTCDSTCTILIVKNERATDLWTPIDAGIAAMGMMTAAQNFGIDSMCIGVIAMEDTRQANEELFGLKKGSLVLGLCLGKKLDTFIPGKKEIKSKIFYKN